VAVAVVWCWLVELLLVLQLSVVLVVLLLLLLLVLVVVVLLLLLLLVVATVAKGCTQHQCAGTDTAGWAALRRCDVMWPSQLLLLRRQRWRRLHCC
jgi:hypothetical protein